MERVKQALELARKERQSRGGRHGLSKESALNAKKSIAEQNIEYTETRSIQFEVNELRKKRIIVEEDNNISDSYRLLRTQILHRLNEKGWNALGITSPNVNSGKTITSINLAISLAREVDYTVLLVDANLRSPKIQDYLSFTDGKGLGDYLCDDVPLSEILIHPEGIPRLVVLPAGQPITNSSEMLSSPKMSRLVEELKHRYPSRIVLFDLPPLLESSDALAFLPNADAALLVIEEGGTKEQELRQANELLQSDKIIGTVLNKAYTREKDYGNLIIKKNIMSNVLSKIFNKTINKLSNVSLPSWVNRKK